MVDEARSIGPVAVDVAGADRGLLVVVDGAVAAYKEWGLTSILVGKESEINNCLASLGASDIPLTVVHAPSVVTMDDSPSRAVRRKQDSSLFVAYRELKEGRASSIISAGNSGAMMAAGMLICGLMPGIERPAIATIVPVAGDGHPTVILDVGANVDCQSEHLVQFAVMGKIYCSSMFEISHPRVALLSNGSESSKGTDVIRQAAAILSKMPEINYCGYVEGRDVCTSAADVVVCDGFVGNVLLKSMEGCARLIGEEIKAEAKRGFWQMCTLGIARSTLKNLFLHKFDYAAYGGAPLLGLRKLGLVLHGSSDARAVKNAVRVAHTFAKLGMVEKIAIELEKLQEINGSAETCESVVSKPISSNHNRNICDCGIMAEREGEVDA